MLLWIAILLLLDAAFGLWFEPRFARALPRVRIRWIALAEGVLGLLLIAWHVLR